MNRSVFSGLGLSLAVLAAVPLTAPLPAAANDRPLTVVAPFEVTSIDPSRSGYIFTRLSVSETLVDVDDSGLPIPGLASGWAASADGTEWRFSLRDGVTFHDGSPMTADSVAAALRHAEAKPGILQQAPITAIDVDGDAVLLRLSQPFSPILASLAHTSTQILAPAAYAPSGDVIEVIGTGPYRLTAVEPPQRVAATRYDGYWGDAPEIASVVYLAASRGETRALMAESGDAELVFTLDPASYTRLSRNDRLDVRSISIPRTITLKVNAGHPWLDSPEARQALSDAIDREGIAAALLRHPEAAASQLFPPGMDAWHNRSLADLNHDPEAARALLAALGWQDSGSGVLERDGEPLRLTLRTFPDRPELPLIAAAMQDQFRTVGIDLTVAIGNSSEIPAGHQDGTLELGLLARNFSLIPDPLGTLVQDFSPGGGDWGAMNWSHDDLAALLDALLRATDPDEIAQARQGLTAILQAELPVIPIAWYQHTVAISGSVDGVVIDPFERTYGIPAIRWAE